MRVTIKDIAQATGYSTATVSLVLNNKPFRIPQQTRRKILTTAKRLGYIKQQTERALKNVHSTTLGVIVPSINYPYNNRIVEGIENECHHNGWSMILMITNNDHNWQLGNIKTLKQRNVDGVIVINHFDNLSDKIVKLLIQLDIPYLVIGGPSDLPGNQVSVDNFYGGYLVGKHLLELGHRKIICLTGDMKLENTKQRLAGFKYAFKELNVACEPTVVCGRYSHREIDKNFSEIDLRNCTALFIFNGLMAFATYSYLRQLGYQIPADFSIVGYDDLQSGYLAPLTTVSQRERELGHRAANILIRQTMTGTHLAEKITLKPKLIFRQSTRRI